MLEASLFIILTVAVLMVAGLLKDEWSVATTVIEGTVLTYDARVEYGLKGVFAYAERQNDTVLNPGADRSCKYDEIECLLEWSQITDDDWRKIRDGASVTEALVIATMTVTALTLALAVGVQKGRVKKMVPVQVAGTLALALAVSPSIAWGVYVNDVVASYDDQDDFGHLLSHSFFLFASTPIILCIFLAVATRVRLEKAQPGELLYAVDETTPLQK